MPCCMCRVCVCERHVAGLYRTCTCVCRVSVVHDCEVQCLVHVTLSCVKHVPCIYVACVCHISTVHEMQAWHAGKSYALRISRCACAVDVLCACYMPENIICMYIRLVYADTYAYAIHASCIMHVTYIMLHACDMHMICERRACDVVFLHMSNCMGVWMKACRA